MRETKFAVMSDGSLVFVILLLGGAFYVALMLWTTVASIRESDANKPPPKPTSQT